MIQTLLQKEITLNIRFSTDVESCSKINCKATYYIAFASDNITGARAAT